MEHYQNLELADIQYFCKYDLINKTEKWRNVLGYNSLYKGLYEVSDLGRVKSLNYNKTNKHGILTQRISNSGYLTTTLTNKKNKNTRSVHRIVAMAFISNRGNKPCVNHKSTDGDKTNNMAKNLEWVTYSENNVHAYKNKLSIASKGECYKSKLTEKEVLEIRNNNSGITQKAMAKLYGVDRVTISDIKRRKSWKHI